MKVPGVAESLVCQESEGILQAREQEEVDEIRETENPEVALI